MDLGLLVGLAVAGVVLAWAWQLRRALARERFLRDHRLPSAVLTRWRAEQGGRSAKDADLVARALRQYFAVRHRAGRRPTAMPSVAAASLWKAQTADAAAYAAFCRQAFGRPVPPLPAVVLGPHRTTNSALRRCFWWACRDEHLDPAAPTRLPLLFALDAKLGWPGGIVYRLDDALHRRDPDGGSGGDGGGDTYCSGDLRSDRYDGTTSGFGDGSGDGGGDGGGGE